MKNTTTRLLCIVAALLCALGSLALVNQGYLDWATTSSPGNPASGFIRLYADSTTGNLTCLSSAGANCLPGIGMVLLEEHTASSSANLSFVTRNVQGQSGAVFQSDFDTYQIEFVNTIPATNNVSLNLNFSTNGGSSYDSSAIYDLAANIFFQSTITAVGSLNNTALAVGGNVSNDSHYGCMGAVKLYNPTSASLYKTYATAGLQCFNNTVGNIIGVNFTGAYRNTTAVNAFQVAMSSGNISSGTIRVYGLSK